MTEIPDNLTEYDLIMLLSASSQFDYQAIAEKAQRIFDTRNAFATVKDRNNIYLL